MNMKKRLLYCLVTCIVLFMTVLFKHYSVVHQKPEQTHTRGLFSSKSEQLIAKSPTRKPSLSFTSKAKHLTPKSPTKKPSLNVSHTLQSATKLKSENSAKFRKCHDLDRYISRTKTDKCTMVFEYVRDCLDRKDSGRTPLPNFFSERNSTGDTDSAYREANVAFVHMPKAGGTSVENVLMKIPGLNKTGVVRKMRVAHCRDLYRHALHFKKYKDQTFFYSKRTFGLHEHAYPRRPFAYATWFREPIDRLISTYFYTKKKHCFGVHKICINYLANSRNLTDYFLKSQNIHFQDMDNFYVRLLQFGDFPEIDTTFEDCCGGVELKDAKTIPKIEEKHYLVARNNLLNKIAFVGLTEDFKTSQDILSYVFGIPFQENETHINANPHKYEVTDSEIAELRRRNIWDLKLYDVAKQIYDIQKKKYLEILKKS